MRSRFSGPPVALLVSSCLALAAASSCAVHRTSARTVDRIAALEAHSGGRIGVMALDTGTGKRIVHRSQERFALCSTFKILLAAEVLFRKNGKNGVKVVSPSSGLTKRKVVGAYLGTSAFSDPPPLSLIRDALLYLRFSHWLPSKVGFRSGGRFCSRKA